MSFWNSSLSESPNDTMALTTSTIARHWLRLGMSMSVMLMTMIHLDSAVQVQAFSPALPLPYTPSTGGLCNGRRSSSSTTRPMAVVEVAAASLLAGSVAGAIGVGVAHPLDTLNIRMQVRQAARVRRERAAAEAGLWSNSLHHEILHDNFDTTTLPIVSSTSLHHDNLSAENNTSMTVIAKYTNERWNGVLWKDAPANGGMGMDEEIASSNGNEVPLVVHQSWRDTEITITTSISTERFATTTKSATDRWHRGDHHDHHNPHSMTGIAPSSRTAISALPMAVTSSSAEYVPTSDAYSSLTTTYALAGQQKTMIPFSWGATSSYPQSHKNTPESAWEVTKQVYEQEGVAGFLGGIRIMMIGQALVKATAFTVNGVVLNFCLTHGITAQGLHLTQPTPTMLLLAATTAGFVSSFIVNPVERVKVLLQADPSLAGMGEIECVQRVLQQEGWFGFLGRGLGPTMLREVPSDAVYFSVYGLLMQQTWLTTVFLPEPWMASLAFGAAAGVASWLPVYPVDLVKTLVQNTQGGGKDQSSRSVEIKMANDSDQSVESDSNNTWMQVVRELYAAGGIGAFYEGMAPKLARAALFHAITFLMYDTILPIFEKILQGSSSSLL